MSIITVFFVFTYAGVALALSIFLGAGIFAALFSAGGK